jgi:hypothetical protein
MSLSHTVKLPGHTAKDYCNRLPLPGEYNEQQHCNCVHGIAQYQLGKVQCSTQLQCCCSLTGCRAGVHVPTTISIENTD